MPTTWRQWALDVTTGWPQFVPVDGDTVHWALVCESDRCPGELVGVVSQLGEKHVEQWCAANPLWFVDWASTAHIRGDLARVAEIPNRG